MNFDQRNSFGARNTLVLHPLWCKSEEKHLFLLAEIFPRVRMMPLEPRLHMNQELYLVLQKTISQLLVDKHSSVDRSQYPLENILATEHMDRSTLFPPRLVFSQSSIMSSWGPHLIQKDNRDYKNFHLVNCISDKVKMLILLKYNLYLA